MLSAFSAASLAWTPFGVASGPSSTTLENMKNLIVLLVLAIASHASASTDFCGNYRAPESSTAAQKDVDERITKFANKKLIAEQADAMLSKLITAKSPVISQWMNRRELDYKTEEDIARAWREYFAMNFVLSKYPNTDAKVNAEIEQLVDGILAEHLKKPFMERIEKLFERAREASIATIQSLPIEKKEDVVKRAKAVKLYWPRNLKSARNNAIPLDLIAWGIAYDPVPNEINIGVRALAYPNDETYLAVFAHEIGHSFDSCRWPAYFKGDWPFAKVGECLRSDKSVKAKKRDDIILERLVAAGRVPKDVGLALKSNPTCNKLVYPPPGTQADQLPESFSDWFSAEVMARMEGVAPEKMRLDLCETKKLVDGSSYPPNADRLNLIYLAQPKLRAKRSELAGAPSPYCALEAPPAK